MVQQNFGDARKLAILLENPASNLSLFPDSPSCRPVGGKRDAVETLIGNPHPFLAQIGRHISSIGADGDQFQFFTRPPRRDAAAITRWWLPRHDIRPSPASVARNRVIGTVIIWLFVVTTDGNASLFVNKTD